MLTVMLFARHFGSTLAHFEAKDIVLFVKEKPNFFSSYQSAFTYSDLTYRSSSVPRPTAIDENARSRKQLKKEECKQIDQ